MGFIKKLFCGDPNALSEGYYVTNVGYTVPKGSLERLKGVPFDHMVEMLACYYIDRKPLNKHRENRPRR